MRRNMFLLVVLSISCLFCLCYGNWIPVAQAATEEFHETYEVNADTALEVHNRNGSVKVALWEKAYVEVNAEKKAGILGDLKNVNIEVTAGETLKIETVHLVRNPKVSVEYEIYVPAVVVVGDVHTSNGAIVLDGTQGDVTAETSNGKIDIQGITGDVNVKTSNGRIFINEIEGAVTEAKTSNGSIEIVQASAIGSLKTSNGSIRAEIRGLYGNEVSIRTSNGPITLDIASDLNVAFDMKTSNGAIEIRGVEIVASDISKTKFKGKMGNGGTVLKIKTSNSSIEVNAL